MEPAIVEGCPPEDTVINTLRTGPGFLVMSSKLLFSLLRSLSTSFGLMLAECRCVRLYLTPACRNSAHLQWPTLGSASDKLHCGSFHPFRAVQSASSHIFPSAVFRPGVWMSLRVDIVHHPHSISAFQSHRALKYAPGIDIWHSQPASPG